MQPNDSFAIFANKSILVTTYDYPDMDGFACSYAYAELLRRYGIDAVAAFWNRARGEVDFVRAFLKLDTLRPAEEIIKTHPYIVLTDITNAAHNGELYDKTKVLEIIDHHEVNEAQTFVQARAQIELVGSAATLIAERWQECGETPSAIAATLLYAAIISNTINFQAEVTTRRDRAMAGWLLEQLTLPDSFITDMFRYKSRISGSLRDFCYEEFCYRTFADTRVGIDQLEIVAAQRFVREYAEGLRAILAEFKQQNNLRHIFLSVIDVLEGKNIFFAPGKETQELLSELVQLHFVDGVAERPGVIMRKQLWPLLKERLGG